MHAYIKRFNADSPAFTGRSDAINFHPFVSNSFGVESSIKPQFSVNTQAEKTPDLGNKEHCLHLCALQLTKPLSEDTW